MDETDKGSFDPLTDQAEETKPDTDESVDQPKPVEDYAAASRQAGNYSSKVAPTPKPPIPDEHDGGHRNLIISLSALIILAAIAGGIYWFTLRHKPSVNTPAAEASTSSTQQKASTSGIDTATTNYTSGNFNLAFSYPSNWTLSDNGGGVMTVKSPTLPLKNAAGQAVSGSIILTVRDHSQKLNEFNAGNATATRDSTKIAYSKPTQTQRANTYISFLQYATTTTQGALDGIYITGDSGYQKGQAIPMVDVQKVDPIISLTFVDATGKAMSIPNSLWDDATISGPLIALLESFSIT